ncbi:hypothetical protein V6N13_059914 [Hibiscus sabdariffa]
MCSYQQGGVDWGNGMVLCECHHECLQSELLSLCTGDGFMDHAFQWLLLCGGHDESWQWRKEHIWGASDAGVMEQRNILESGESVTGIYKRSYKCVIGVVVEDKREVLDTCVVAWCKGGLRERALVEDLRRADIYGCSVMRILGAFVLLMFAMTEEQQSLLDRTYLDRWFERVMTWARGIRLDSLCVWLSVVVLPMHLLWTATFENLARLWGCFVRLEGTTAEPQSFERARFLIEMNRLERIEEMVEVLASDSSIIRVHVQEVEVVQSHDIVCPCDQDSEDGRSEDTSGVEHEGQTTRDRPTVEVVLCKGLPQKVQSVNDLVIDTLSPEQQCRLLKAQGKGKRGKPRKEGVKASLLLTNHCRIRILWQDKRRC